MSDLDEPTTPVRNLEMEVAEECSNSSLPDTNTRTLETTEADEGPKNHDSQEKRFATIEGELLDFEDFNEKIVDVDKTVDVKSSESEDGQCATPEESAHEKDGSIEEGEDEGVCSEDEDLEEGEISSEKKENSQSAVCRFYHRGMCYYGSACRFLHPNDKKGNYNMFDTVPRVYTESYSTMGSSIGMNHHRRPIPFQPAPPVYAVQSAYERGLKETKVRLIPFIPAPPPPVYEVESAWERGLKEAKVLLKQANKRKDEPDFEEKRLNMGLGNKKYSSDFDKENDSSLKRQKKSAERRDNFKYQEVYNFSNDFNDYSKESYPRVHEGEKDARERSKVRKPSVERFSRAAPRHRWNNSRMDDARTQRSDHAHTFFDPWQRSKSPTRNRTSRSVSCSPVSSYSRSSRSSRSSSRSSYGSSRRTSSSRSRSRSLSMDSVSSASSRNSSVSHSSGSVSFKNRKAKPVGRGDALSNIYPKSPPKVKTEALEENFQKPLEVAAIPSLHHLMPNFLEKPREPVRGLHKQPIRLTLLNKNPQPKLSDLPKKYPDAIKKSEELTKTNLQRGAKRSLSPAAHAPPPAKKSASSRRDDLLKQLRAVEDAIARKRAKF